MSQLTEGVEAEAEGALSVAALLLARGDAPPQPETSSTRCAKLERHRSLLSAALDLLVDAQLAQGQLDQA